MTEKDTEPTMRTSRQRRLTSPDNTLASTGEQPQQDNPSPSTPVEATPVAPPVAEIPPPPFVEEIEPADVPSLQGSGLRPHDVVQVIDPGSRLYGAFFAVGDVRHGKVHGYYMTEGRAKQFITVAVNMVHPVTKGAKVRSANPCSPKWLSDNQ